MAIDVLSANVLDGFSNGETARHLTQRIAELKPDVAIFLEAYAEGQEEHLPVTEERFRMLGYRVLHAPYDDKDNRTDRHGIMAITRTEIVEPSDIGLIPFAGRTGIYMTAFDEASGQEVDIYGVHMDDRKEITRLEQVYDFIEIMKPDRLSALAGDLNAMHGRDTRARLIRSTGPIARLLPVADPSSLLPNPNGELPLGTSKIARIGSLATRLAGMATGSTLAMLEEVGMRDADPAHKPTMPYHRFVPPIAQLDHIMVSRQVEVLGHERLALCDDGGQRLTDHFAIRAQLTATA